MMFLDIRQVRASSPLLRANDVIPEGAASEKIDLAISNHSSCSPWGQMAPITCLDLVSGRNEPAMVEEIPRVR